MPRPLHHLLIGTVLCAVLVAGCGGGSKKTETQSNAPAAASTATESATTTASASSKGTASSQVRAAIDACKQSVDAQGTLSSSTKDDLKNLCEKAASGDAAAVQKATVDVCKKIVEESVPAGSSQDAAMSACNQAAGNGGGSTTPDTVPTTTTGGASASGAGLNPNNPQVKAAIAACKQSVAAQPTLSAGAKKDLATLCEKAASGDSAAVKKATREVCIKVVKESVPAGAAQDAALASCNK
jgi:hypothetical protein